MGGLQNRHRESTGVAGPSSASRSNEGAGATRVLCRLLPRLRETADRSHRSQYQSRASLGFLTHDFGDESRQPRHLGQAECYAVLCQLSETPTVVQATARDVTYLVVELGPTGALAPVTETYEVEGGVGGWVLGAPARIHRCTCSLSVPARIAEPRNGPQTRSRTGFGSLRVSPQRQVACMLGGLKPNGKGVSPPSLPRSSPQNVRSAPAPSSGASESIRLRKAAANGPDEAAGRPCADLPDPKAGESKSRIPNQCEAPGRRRNGPPCGVGPREENAPWTPSGGVGWRELVPHIGFEPMISALRGRCPGPLDECGIDGRPGASRAG